MPPEFYLVDTSAWLYALRKEYSPVIKDRLDHLLQENRIMIAGIIKLELLGGTKSEKEFQRLKLRLDALEACEMNEALWEQACKMAFELRRNGVTIPYTDILIASTALACEATLLHVDAHFDLVAQFFPLKVESYVGKI